MPQSIPGLPYKILTQTNDAYDSDLISELEDLYIGGYRIRAKARRYLTKMALETDSKYDERCKITAFLPFFSQIVDQFVSDVAVQPLTVIPPSDSNDSQTPGEYPDKDFYASLAKDADLCGHSLEDVLLGALRTALKHGRGIIGIDAPSLDEAEGTDKPDEEDAPDRLYLYECPVESLIDWKVDRFGQFEWLVMYKCERSRVDITSDRTREVESFTTWSLEDGVAVWRRFEVAILDGHRPDTNTVIPCVAEGATDFKRIPFVMLELPEGLWIGNKIGPINLEHWQRRSSLIGAQNRSLVAIPLVRLGSELGSPGGELPSEAQANPRRGADPLRKFEERGFVVLGAGDGMEFVEPAGHAYEIIDKQLDELKQAAFAIVHQMAASIKPTGAALGRSGLSKQKDEDKTARVLGHLGKKMRDFGLQIYSIISEARGEDVRWVAHGMDQFEKTDREEIMNEALQLDAINIPSVTFKKAYKTRVAEKLLDSTDPAQLAQIREEIQDGVEEEEKQKENEKKIDLQREEDMHHATIESKKNPPPVVSMPGAARDTKEPKSDAKR